MPEKPHSENATQRIQSPTSDGENDERQPGATDFGSCTTAEDGLPVQISTWRQRMRFARSQVRRGNPAALGAADWLSLAAAPTFAIMALLTAVLGGATMDAICSAAHDAPLSGMVPMYLLMSAFHLSPWLNLLSSRRGRSFQGCG